MALRYGENPPLFFVVALGSEFPDQGSNLHPLHWKHRVLITGRPGKSPSSLFSNQFGFRVSARREDVGLSEVTGLRGKSGYLCPLVAWVHISRKSLSLGKGWNLE